MSDSLYPALVLAACVVAFAWSVWVVIAACRDATDYSRVHGDLERSADERGDAA